MRMLKTMIAVLLVGTASPQPLFAQQAPPPAAAADDSLPKVSAVNQNGVLMLVPGRTLTVGWTAGGRPVQISEGPAGAKVAVTVPIDPDKETWSKATVKEAPAPDGQLIFSMWADPLDGVTVLLKNGGKKPVAYIARMVLPRGDKFEVVPTTICAAPPKSIGAELWADPVQALIVVGIMEVEDHICIDAASMKTYRVGEQPPSVAK